MMCSNCSSDFGFVRSMVVAVVRVMMSISCWFFGFGVWLISSCFLVFWFCSMVLLSSRGVLLYPFSL